MALRDGADRALTFTNDPNRRLAFRELMRDLFGPMAEG
jgi:hypothetical protein